MGLSDLQRVQGWWIALINHITWFSFSKPTITFSKTMCLEAVIPIVGFETVRFY